MTDTVLNNATERRNYKFITDHFSTEPDGMDSGNEPQQNMNISLKS
jgi:hypothetical protein